MFNKSFQYYDDIYSFKNYQQEAESIAALIRREHPGAQTILDVACGTAEHARFLSAQFSIDGVDLEPCFIEQAKKKVPSGTFLAGDMRSFDMGKQYDVVQCLFSSIGYLLEKKDVVEALRTFERHLKPDGIILVEPWITPEEWHVGTLHMTMVDRPDLKICRMNVSEQEGNISKIRFHYLVAKREGVERFEEDHAVALYSVAELLECFETAGLSVSHDPEGIFGRGMYVARAKG